MTFLKHYRLKRNTESNFLPIEYYTRTGFYYKVLNNCLRAFNKKNIHDLQYAKLPFSDIFLNIKELYLQQFETILGEHNSVTVHRGCQMVDSEIDFMKGNKGKHIQLEGFVSTSRDESICERFIDGVLLEITISREEMRREDCGFADISWLSEFPGEKEILINSMNTFEVEDYKEKKKFGKLVVHWFKLRYVGMTKLKEGMLKEDKLEDRQLQLIKNYDYQQKHAARSKADLLFESEEWKEAIVQAKQEVLRLEVQRRLQGLKEGEGLNLMSLRESLPLIKII